MNSKDCTPIVSPRIVIIGADIKKEDAVKLLKENGMSDVMVLTIEEAKDKGLYDGIGSSVEITKYHCPTPSKIPLDYCFDPKPTRGEIKKQRREWREKSKF